MIRQQLESLTREQLLDVAGELFAVSFRTWIEQDGRRFKAHVKTPWKLEISSFDDLSDAHNWANKLLSELSDQYFADVCANKNSQSGGQS